MSEGAYRTLRAPTVAHWYQRVPNGIWLYLRMPTSVCEWLLVAEVAYVCLWVTTCI